jgi:hypothetical protein
MFQQATRLKLRFETSKGQLSVEDLWDLPLTSTRHSANLDDLARTLHEATKTEHVSFVNKAAPVNELQKLRFDIVLHIINTRIGENDAAATARANREKKQQIMALIDQKQNEALGALSVEDLRKMVESL